MQIPGNAYPLDQQLTCEVKGRDLVAGVPKTVIVNSDEIRESLAEPTNAIVEAVLLALGEDAALELAADIVDKEHIVLTGGGAPVAEPRRALARGDGTTRHGLRRPHQRGRPRERQDARPHGAFEGGDNRLTSIDGAAVLLASPSTLSST